MGAVNNHAHPIHFADEFTAEIGQAAILVMTAATGCIVAVIGEQHLPHAESIETLAHADVALRASVPSRSKASASFPSSLAARTSFIVSARTRRSEFSRICR